MKRYLAEAAVTEYLKPIYGFTLRRCRTPEDAEDLTQEIVLRAFGALLVKDDVADVGKFMWTVAHNALANYYRRSSREIVGLPIDEYRDIIADPDSYFEQDDTEESIGRLRREIAYLSKVQRRVVIAYYFDRLRQEDISKELGIPLGTVKWHLFEAKKELKRGMDKMRKASDLKFNPVEFSNIGLCGSSGTKSPSDYLRSALAQNICYCVRKNAKTVGEIADSLGVSPVYVESEAEALEEYGLLEKRKDRYVAAFIIDEFSEALLVKRNEMYRRCAEIFASELFDELTASGILDDANITCGQTDGELTLTGGSEKDRNFMLWSLIPYIAARSGETEEKIPFEKAATHRPDGGHNIVHATLKNDSLTLPGDYVYMNNWCGPMWNSRNGMILWQIDSEWSDRGDCRGPQFKNEASRVLELFEKESDGLPLTRSEYAYLVERGYEKTCGDVDGQFKAPWQVVVIHGEETDKKLLAIGDRIKGKHKAELDALTDEYRRMLLAEVPEHLKTMQEYELQFLLSSDGWFILHCIRYLLDTGKLLPPTKEQRRALTTVLITE